MSEVKRGQFYDWAGDRVEILAVPRGGKWARIYVHQGNSSFAKRLDLPLPDEAKLIDLTTRLRNLRFVAELREARES